MGNSFSQKEGYKFHSKKSKVMVIGKRISANKLCIGINQTLITVSIVPFYLVSPSLFIKM